MGFNSPSKVLGECGEQNLHRGFLRIELSSKESRAVNRRYGLPCASSTRNTGGAVPTFVRRKFALKWMQPHAPLREVSFENCPKLVFIFTVEACEAQP
ncbi:hypothetical protein QV65_21050 [Rhodococcus erythropolis]|nr:hypothetical protein QV65_21050 [Rhodococcus erythropolis]